MRVRHAAVLELELDELLDELEELELELEPELELDDAAFLLNPVPFFRFEPFEIVFDFLGASSS